MPPAPINVDPLRPTSLDEFSGQHDVIRELRIVLQAAREREEVSDHILLSGPPGLGKTTLAQIIANELDLAFMPTSGPVIDKPGDLAAILTSMNARTLLFIDEIHRMPRVAEEMLYTAMEDRRVDVVAGEGVNARTFSLNISPFVLIGATTQSGLLSAPLRDRFGYTPRLELYDTDTLTRIVQRSAHLLDLNIDTDGAHVIAMRSRGTPRLANRLLRRVRDFAQVENIAHIDASTATWACEAFRVDSIGLDPTGRAVLDKLCVTFRGGPVGLTTLAAAVGEQPVTVEEVYEPYLLHRGLLARTPRGRVATVAAYEHLGLEPPTNVVLGQTQLRFDPAGDETD
jgi:Holliday junction DNA helicase RuvB